MLEALHALVAPAAVERLTLLINHVLSSEAVAMQRLRPHAGRCIGLQLRGWPALLPAPPALSFRVTPAGLLEWCGEAPPAQQELRVDIDASNPALLGLRWLTGTPPAMDIQGDAAFAADVHWLADHLRWDVAADLERLFGPIVARELERGGQLLAAGLRRVVQAGGDLAARLRPGEGWPRAR
jgi:ubiquinone biosynthesis protein UbiJ